MPKLSAKRKNAPDRIKANGVHYTPPELAKFLASALLRSAELPEDGPVSVLDPACGDGGLLASIAEEAPPPLRRRLRLVGYDTDSQALAKAAASLCIARVLDIDLRKADFLSSSNPSRQQEASLFHSQSVPPGKDRIADFDLIISNPPYVRTQILGASRAQELADAYQLSGRVDLYHAFVRAMASALRIGGALALLTSNRFLYTLAGAATRRLLTSQFELCELFDLGDTKLFSAAVLPAIVIARRSADGHRTPCPFARIYESRAESTPAPNTSAFSALDAIQAGFEGPIRIGSANFNVDRGVLSIPQTSKQPWTLSSSRIDDWLRTVGDHTQSSFADIGKVRVGIKTTADEVFIRDDWHRLPSDQCPEPELLRPLLRSYMARPWRAEAGGATSPKVLYPHTVRDGQRTPVDLAEFPQARAYLERHKDRLASRRYVIDSGRQWYEIWVPQNPEDWKRPKVVFPDISETPRFFLNRDGAVVNGDCYWITLLPNRDARWLFLLLAVANSSFITSYYDHVFGNKLYAGRRRFITQYVQHFPLPHLEDPASRQIVGIVEGMVYGLAPSQRDAEIQVDRLVWRAFGFSSQEKLSR